MLLLLSVSWRFETYVGLLSGPGYSDLLSANGSRSNGSPLE